MAVVGFALPSVADAPSSAPNAKCERTSSPPDAVIDACTVELQNASLTPLARAELLLVRGQAAAFLGKNPEAVADFGQVIDITGKLSAALKTGSRDAVIFGPGANVPNSYVGRLSSVLATAYGERGTSLRREGKVEQAMADLNEALRVAPKYPLALWQRGIAWQQKGRSDLALADLSAAIRANPKWAPPYATRGDVYSDQGDGDRALADLNEAIRLAPKFYGAYLNRSTVLDEKHDYAAALADSNFAIGLLPNDPSALTNRAIIWSHEGELEKAVADETTIIELYATGHPASGDDPPRTLEQNYAEAVAARAGFYAELGNLAAAKADAARAAQLDPADDSSWNAGCSVRAVANVELDVALADCERALQLAQTAAHRADILDSRAMVRYRQGGFDLAIADEDAAIAASPKTPEFKFMRGLAEEAAGKLDGGRADVAAALAINPKLAGRYARWGLKPN